MQFLTFAERLSNVNIDVIHRVDRTGSYAEVCTANKHTEKELASFSDSYKMTILLFTGGRNILLRRTDKMERPELDGTF